MQNARSPAPASTIARQVRSVSRVPSVSRSASLSSMLSAFIASGRLSVSVTTPLSRSTSSDIRHRS